MQHSWHDWYGHPDHKQGHHHNHHHHHVHHRGGLKGMHNVMSQHQNWFRDHGADMPTTRVAMEGRSMRSTPFAPSHFGGDQGFTASLPAASGSAGLVSSGAKVDLTNHSEGSAPDGTVKVDLAHHTATMPDGKTFEVHSGNGAGMDNVAYAHTRMVGPPSPGNYGLQSTSFFKDQAWLLNGVPGRDGVLFHSAGIHLRGDPRPGASEGCVTVREDQWPEFKREMAKNHIRKTSISA
jgi:hypothetical protein